MSPVVKVLAAIAAGLAVALACTAAEAQGDGALVGGWQGWTVEPAYGTPVRYEPVLYADGRYARSYRPTAYSGGVFDSGRWHTQGNLIRFDIVQWEVVPARPNAPQPAGDTFVYQLGGPAQLALTTPSCMWPNPQMCTVVLQRTN